MASTATATASAASRPMFAPSQENLDSFERHTAWPMLVLSLAIIPLLVIPLVADLSPATEGTLFAIDWFLWAAFARLWPR